MPWLARLRRSPDRAMAFFDQVLERVGGLPGVQAVGIGSQLPLGVGVGWGKHLDLDPADGHLPGSLADRRRRRRCQERADESAHAAGGLRAGGA
jgi:hypothetical protein